VQPKPLQTLTVGIGQTSPTVIYTATYNGAPANAAWTIDKGNIGSVPQAPTNMAQFAPKGAVGGLVNVVAGYNGQTATRQVFVKLNGAQNGSNPSDPSEAAQIATDPGMLNQGGGIGGVGGEGLGPAVTDPGALAGLGNPSGNGSAQGFKWLYPYDATVWPRGMLAPLLMWDWSMGDADAIKIELATTSGSFTWSGTFAKPPILQQTGGKFVRHPIPQDIWQIATETAGGATPSGAVDNLTVKLTVVKGGVGYGPIAETWTVAPARLTGTIYYNSYGTNLAKNYGGAVGGNHQFGGAVLSIRVGDTGPKLAAGNDNDCRVCHSVAAKGSRLVVQRGDNYSASSVYDLTPAGNTESALATGATFPAVAPDGSFMLSPSGAILPLPNDSNPPAVTGLSSVATDLGTPAFSPDGKRVVFNPMAGPGVSAPGRQLIVMDYAANAFSNAVTVHDDSGQPADVRPGWPAFFPDGSSVVFEHQSKQGADGGGGALYTRKGAKGQIAWTSAAASGSLTALNQLNGLDAAGTPYLPKLPAPYNLGCTADGLSVGGMDADHGDDPNLNYEPTVNPVASGGYAWVVFTSRRLYGNEAVIPPFCSDPRGVDLVQNITTKKLWVAAIDLNQKAGVDASHPAFYLPAQELLAGNARGFWVLDPCRSDGDSCLTGDQCCNGYCEPNGMSGALVCSNMPPNNNCSKLQEKCTTASDCCDQTAVCVNGFCAMSKPLRQKRQGLGDDVVGALFLQPVARAGEVANRGVLHVAVEPRQQLGGEGLVGVAPEDARGGQDGGLGGEAQSTGRPVVVDGGAGGAGGAQVGDVGIHDVIGERVGCCSLHHALEVEARSDEQLGQERQLEEQHVPGAKQLRPVPHAGAVELGVGAVDHHQSVDDLGAARRGGEGEGPAPVVADDVGLRPSERVDEPGDVVHESRQRVRADALRTVGRAIPAQIGGGHAIPVLGEGGGDVAPGARVLGKPVEEDHERPVVGPFEGHGQRDVGDGDSFRGHGHPK
jgi:hypothetical protein